VQLFAVGVGQTSAPLWIREQLSIAGLELEAALTHLRSRRREGLILSTCARTELYGVVSEPVDPIALLLEVVGKRNVSPSDVRAASYVHWNEAAVRHALRVASGIESLVLGEDQIQAQMKRAVAQARDAGTLGPTLERLGAAALTCGKRVRASTGIGRHSVSLESLAVRAVQERVGALAERHVVVIGAGESAALVLRHLTNADAKHLTLVSRSAARATTLAESSAARALGAADLPDALTAADVIFCCTSAPHPVVTTSLLSQRMVLRPGAPLLCVDLGMPRDVDWPVRALPHVTVLALDDLEGMAEAHRAARREHIPAAEAIVERETGRFLAWQRTRGVVTAIAVADARASDVVEKELGRALARLSAATPRDREIVTQMAHRIARKLIHDRIDVLKHDGAREQPVRLVEESAS
jgi:glutamyl-tRNA reductase